MRHLRNFRLHLARVVLGAALLPLVAACAWQVPADPGLNFKYRSRASQPAAFVSAPAEQVSVSAASDEGARALYLDHCSRCHQPFDPQSVPAAQWPLYVAKYAPRAGLFGTDRSRVLAWLQANAP
ncbi:MAG: hypothetical protein O2894_00780 [Planctomycetota bacterium]|nr:hypothetical protein [Planctomycetota bacterium]